MRTSYIYGLVDPIDNEIRYVGQSLEPHIRIGEHLRDRTGSPKSVWLQALYAKSLIPLVVILETVSCDDPYYRERHWINRLYILGCKLLNSEVYARFANKRKKLRRKHSSKTINLSGLAWFER